MTVADEGDDLSETVFLGNERVAVSADFKTGFGELVDGVLDFHVDFGLKVSVAVVASMPKTLRKFLRIVNTNAKLFSLYAQTTNPARLSAYLF